MSEARYPAWLDGPIDRCPVCGSERVAVAADDEGWEVGCFDCHLVRQDSGPAPGSVAAWLALTAAGRWALHGLGHPLGVAR